MIFFSLLVFCLVCRYQRNIGMWLKFMICACRVNVAIDALYSMGRLKYMSEYVVKEGQSCRLIYEKSCLYYILEQCVLPARLPGKFVVTIKAGPSWDTNFTVIDELWDVFEFSYQSGNVMLNFLEFSLTIMIFSFYIVLNTSRTSLSTLQIYYYPSHWIQYLPAQTVCTISLAREHSSQAWLDAHKLFDQQWRSHPTRYPF